MSIVEPGSAGAGLIARVKAILMQPSATWDVIDTEPATTSGLYTRYVIPLAAIPPVCSLIGSLVFGIGAFGFSYRPNPVAAVAQAIVSFGLGLAMVFVMALIIEALAPNFGGTKDRTQAMKVAAYAPTASWVAGIFGLIPMLAIIALLGGLYSLYLLYLGLPKLMKTPQDKALPYFVVVLVVAIVLSIVIGAVAGGVATMGMLGGSRMGMSAPGHVTGKVNIPGQGSIDLGKLEEASKRMEAASKQIQSGEGVQPTDPDVLKGYLPASIAGYSRTEVEASTGGVGGIQGSGVKARYERGDAHMRLEVTDLGAAGAFAGMASAFDVKSSKETASGYEKVGKVDGRFTEESYDRDSRHGEYKVLVGDRFMIEATGDGVSIDELKAAVGAVGLPRLEALAKAG
ncbi:MAG: DUF1282 domain-containing protein [Phenylobacterium sp.]|uniref:Yip1 family protein n=1 Tax=Phenylobacterium sp. TaxID=1871053 RepID=UPI0025E70177|nr:Yip1 family protein [Phenylobacterium sp.]MBI1200690.1 DUF1282 domain-containing protein [Phenylobacterium sp.]